MDPRPPAPVPAELPVASPGPLLAPADAGAGWTRAPRRPRLRPGEVHVWRAPLDVPGAEPGAPADTLSPDEWARAGRFVQRIHAERYVAARRFLRAVLAAYLGAPPGALRFRYSARGKPSLDAPHGGEVLGFNLSHAGDRALCAVAPARFVGVDVEAVAEEVPVDELTAPFSPRERTALAALPPAERREAFFRGWTRKEALVKALGDGLSAPVERFEVSLGADEPPRVVATPPGPVAAWWLADVSPAAGFAGAVAVEGAGWRLRCWDAPADD